MDAGRSFNPLAGVRSGQLIGGKYLLLEPLGAGGMAQVWAARNLDTDAEVAIKLLHTSNTAADRVARFRREAYTTGLLTHRGIVRIFDLIEDPETDGCLAIVMERFRGKTLANVLREKKVLTIDHTLRIFLPLLSALDHAHYFGVIHRDLKPENIFLAIEPDGEVIPKLLDFGISKMMRDGNAPITGSGEIVGTPQHMSPEQLRGGPLDARSDVFGAGIVLYMCLTGRHPFVASESVRAVVAVLEEDPPCPENLPFSLWYVLRRALEKKPRDRFESAAALAAALAQSVGGESALRESKTKEEAPTLTGVRILPEGSQRRRVGFGVAACVAGIWLGSIGAASRAGEHGSVAVGLGLEATASARPETTAAPRPLHRLRPSFDVLRSEGAPAPMPSATALASAPVARPRARELAVGPGF